MKICSFVFSQCPNSFPFCSSIRFIEFEERTTDLHFKVMQRKQKWKFRATTRNLWTRALSRNHLLFQRQIKRDRHSEKMSKDMQCVIKCIQSVDYLFVYFLFASLDFSRAFSLSSTSSSSQFVRIEFLLSFEWIINKKKKYVKMRKRVKRQLRWQK